MGNPGVALTGVVYGGIGGLILSGLFLLTGKLQQMREEKFNSEVGAAVDKTNSATPAKNLA